MIQGGAAASSPYFNDRNREEPANYWPDDSKCAYFVGIEESNSHKGRSSLHILFATGRAREYWPLSLKTVCLSMRALRTLLQNLCSHNTFPDFIVLSEDVILAIAAFHKCTSLLDDDSNMRIPTQSNFRCMMVEGPWPTAEFRDLVLEELLTWARKRQLYTCAGAQWTELHSLPFVLAHESPSLFARALYIPFESARRNKIVKYVLYGRKAESDQDLLETLSLSKHTQGRPFR